MLIIDFYVKAKVALIFYIKDMDYAIIVIDIGMTNKKVVVYDQNLVQQDAVYKSFEAVLIDGIPTHNIKDMWEWFKESISHFAKKYPVKAISITTHGATFVGIDKNGEPCIPCVMYTYQISESLENDFYKLCGSPIELQTKTCTPSFSAMINMAKGIYFAQKQYPNEFKNVNTLLNYPQYLAYLFTGKFASEPTFMACHTYLWNHKEGSYSFVADKLGIRSLLPDVKPTCSFLGCVKTELAKELSLKEDVLVTVGLHSNASLLPYLIKNENKDFILNSTGTWCVAMYNRQSIELNSDDEGKIVFYNRSALDTPVKTAIFLGGLEADTYVKLWQRECNTSDYPSSTEQALKDICAKKDVFIIPEVVKGSGQFPKSRAGIWQGGEFFPLEDIQSGKNVPAILRDRENFFAALDLSLAFQSEMLFLDVKLETLIFIQREAFVKINYIMNC